MTIPGRVSAFIPCRNEVKYIKNCVEAILANNYPDIEIIVVDGMSDDGTREILKDLCERHANIKVIDNPNRLTPFAFNLGVLNSTGEFVQIAGARNVLAQDYLGILVDTLKKYPQVGCVGGDYQHTYENEDSKFISQAMESKFGVGGSNYRTMQEDCFVDTVGVPMYRKTIFGEVGMFDERLTRNQDDEFNYRVTQKGYKIKYVHRAKTLYYVRASLDKAFSQFFQYGYFKVFVNQKHKTFTTLRQLVPPAFVAFLFLGLMLSFIALPIAFVYIAVLMLYALLGWQSTAEFTPHFRERLTIQKAILILHLAYGLGYLRGIWDFLVWHRQPQARLQKQTT
jgi:cellulose synthase/poly-beta-1,6-N-acetylglucosamine synthase-like glycosyltransferase